MKTNSQQKPVRPKRPAARHASDARGDRVPQLIELGRIRSNPLNPRLEFEESSLRGLAYSFKSMDVLHPIHVRRSNQPGTYQLISGERRLRAAAIAGMASIPAFVCDVSPEVAARMVVTENLQRENLNPIEKARALKLLTVSAEEGGGAMHASEVGELIGMSRSGVINMIRLLKLPDEWQKRIITGDIPARGARSLLSVLDRPEVLQAIELDFEEHPDQWRLAEDVEQRVKMFRDGFDTVAETSEASGTDDVSVETSAIPRRAVAVDHGTDGLKMADAAAVPDPFARALRAIGDIEAIEQIDQLQAALTSRRAVLEKRAADNEPADKTAAARPTRRKRGRS